MPIPRYPRPDLCGMFTGGNMTIRIPCDTDYKLGRNGEVCSYVFHHSRAYISPLQCIVRGTLSPDKRRFIVTVEHVGENPTFVNGSLIRRGTRREIKNRGKMHFDNSPDGKNHALVFKLFRPNSIDSKMLFIRSLGKGGGGQVLHAVNLVNGSHFAVKKVTNTLLPAHKNPGLAELQVLKRLDHPHIIRLLGVRSDFDYYYFIMPLAFYGSVGDVCNGLRIHESDVRAVAKSIAHALRYLHVEVKVVHLDVKPQNILVTCLSPLTVKLADFGLARSLESGGHQSVCGTTLYMAPEVAMAGKFPYFYYDYKADCWSLGVTIYMLLAGRYPFEADELYVCYEDLDSRFDRRTINWAHLPVSVSPLARDVLSHLIEKDAICRLSSSMALNHAWLEGDLPSIVTVNDCCESITIASAYSLRYPKSQRRI